ncbi:MAG: ATP synthase F1 subunit delta [Gemmatimonas sp.]|nr:ATP synthase F1 subunit delta [Gemmatimonas sp.]
MGPALIARNYAETLLTLAKRHGGDSVIDEFGAAIDEVAELLRREPLVREFLETPRIDLEAKKKAIRGSFGGRVPDLFLRFLLVVVEKRRQALLQEIAEQYQVLVDEARGRVRAEIVLAHEPDDTLREEIAARLERRLGKRVVPSYRVDPALIGGVEVRVGGEILDGSVRRRVVGIRRRLLAVGLPGVPTDMGPEM